tara:strand:+ start:100 stop:426 length:327 start_codon:yes stop_codon:yes gene_type:complete
MAQNFRRFSSNNVGTSVTSVYTADSYDTIVGIALTNVHTSSINVDVYINDGTNDIYLVKSAPIPVGSQLQIIDGGAKVVVQSGDVIKVKSDVASSCDVWISAVDAIST